MEKLLKSSMRTLNNIYKEKAILPSKVTEACLERAKQTQHLNAYINLTCEHALKQAKKCDDRLNANKRIGPLDGVPISLKDNFCTKNVRTTCASTMLENFIPPYNATVCQRLYDAGAISIGKTNMDQFAMGSGSVDSLYGPVKNQWNYCDEENFHITGGSSGGAAVSVGSYSCYGSLGTDTGGSVRNPAAYCGIVGLKPTYGLISRYGLIPLLNSMDCVGIFSRNVDDCVTMLNVIAGPDEKDSTNIKRPFKKIMLPKNTSIKGITIGIPKEYYCDNLDQEVYDTWKYVADVLEQEGAIVKQVSLPHTKHSIVCYSIINQCEISSSMSRYDGIRYGYLADTDECSRKIYTASRYEGFNNVVRSRIITGNYFLLKSNIQKYFYKALKVRRLIYMDFDNAFNEVQVLLAPTVLSTAPKYFDFIKKANRDQCAVQDYCTAPINIAGVPGLAIPIRLSSTSGLPIGLQLIGKNLSECLLCTVGKHLENIVQFPKYQCDF